MSEPRPQPLRYQTPGGVQSDARSTAARFVLGILAGTAVSAIFWFGGRSVPWTLLGLVLVPLVKLLVALWLRSLPPWRSFAAGLLVSIGVGFLIFFFTCASEFTITG